MEIWFLSWKSALKVFEVVRNTKTEVELDAWRRPNHKYDPRNPLRNKQRLERMLALSQVGKSNVVASMERVEPELRVVRQRFGDDVQNLWKSRHMVCFHKICPKILRDHFAAQASSIDSLEKRELTIEKFLQANVHRSGATPMDVDALAKTKGGKKGGKGEDKRQVKENCRQLFLVWRVWSHDARLSNEGSRETASSRSPRKDPIRSRRAKAKLAKARRERRPLTSGQTVRNIHRLMRNSVADDPLDWLVPFSFRSCRPAHR